MAISGIIFIKIIKDIRHITQKAASAADNIEQAAQFFRNTSGATAVTKILSNAVDVFKKGRSKKEKD
jgi:hypothetical protein